MTQDNQMNQIPKTFAGTRHPLYHLVDGKAVATVELATDGIGQVSWSGEQRFLPLQQPAP